MSDHKQTFNTDVTRLLDIVANALYTNRDVFLRELISNAADACDRLRYEAIQKPDLTSDNPDFKIHITRDTDANTLTISDNGIGMNAEDMAENLGTIARSGTAKIMEAMQDQKGDLNLIGQFGVGFYASFMIATQVTVISRKAGETQNYKWISDGKTGYTTEETDEAPALGRGTSITLALKTDAYDYLLEDKLKQIISTYSDHIDVPVFVGEVEEPVNKASALWVRSKSEITDEQYKEFYHHIGQVYDEPQMTLHWKAEGKIEFNALLYVPSMRPWDLYDPTRKHAVRLYVKRVFITDDCEGLVYPWLRFIRGVIDSEDLPLNISREMLQMNPVVDLIRRGVTKKILSELNKLAEKDEAAFETIWGQFGMVIKEGLYDAAEHREDIFKICRFYSSDNPEKLISLQDYLDGMIEGQRSIYYMAGENLDTLKNSPQLEGFKSRGLTVLFMTDTVDQFWLQQVSDYKEKFFQSITKGAIDLSKFDKKDGDVDDENHTPEKPSENVETVLGLFKKELENEVHDVRISTRLTDSPVCLIAPDNAVDIHMESVLKIQQKYEPQTKPVLEINKDHPLIVKLADLGEGDVTKDAAWLLLDQAKIIQGKPVDDPSAFARRMSTIMEKGLAA